MRIRAFEGLRPSHESVEKVVALPYDVVSTEEARALAGDNPHSLLHVTRAEIDFPAGQDPYSEDVYSKAVENFQRLQEDGHLIRETEPCIYLYQQQMGSHRQRGIAAVSHVDDYDCGKIKRHERTRVAKENDRTRLTGAMSANAGPVFLTYRDDVRITSLMDAYSQEEPLYDITADDGIRHTVWRIPGGSDIVRAFKSVESFYVADGHHRAASAARVAMECRKANPHHHGEEDYNWFLTVLFPANELKILAYNRLVADLNGRGTEEFLQEVAKLSAVQEGKDPVPENPNQIRIYVNGVWYGIELYPEEGADPVSSLDVSLLQDRILDPLLSIKDPRTDDRIEFVGGIRGTDYLKKEVDEGRAAVAFSLYPVQISQLLEIADADSIMAPKSTWFEPKLRSGFFIHTF